MASTPLSPADKSAATTASTRQMSSLARLGGAFLSPVATFADIAREPHYRLALALECLAALVFGVAALHKIGAENIVANSMAASGRAQSIPADQMPAVIHRAVGATTIAMYASPVFVIVLALLVGLIFFGGIRLILGKEQVSFKQSFSMVVHAYLPFALLNLILVAVAFLSPDPTHLNPQNMLGSSLGFYMDPLTTAKPLYALGTHLDLFPIWVVALLGIGTAKLAGSKKLSTGLGLSFGLWGLWLLIMVGMAAI